ncbi:MAG TPA: heterodisulfide reductase-related iron-sulfur binding cluster, partial [Solirubrobacteraceae bacterium]|nr:heterodisulfide reductase-related iron-sulfur binding cluster [Solirubrobacteraceae bacterium]
RLLHELLVSEVVTDGWDSQEVFDALDLCLACKGCTSDCPVQVDMPTYKAEFLHHHNASPARRRPRYAYAFGFIDQAARLASRIPGVVNLLARTPPSSRLAKRVGGIDTRRSIPSFAPVTLQRWFADRGPSANPGARRVVLWPDTFNNFFHTDVGVACVEALEAAGWHVVIPEGHVCCGRPLYDYGFLDQARAYLQRTLDVLREEIRAGTPVVGMEPSCLAVFKDELGRMLPYDDDARRLAANAFHFDEFLERFDADLPRLEGRALVWGHCHHKATGGISGEERALERMGLEVESVAGGCCGLAGSWGFEEGKYKISMSCGEHALLPAVRDAPEGSVIVADGFSCKTQIEQAGTGRRALHLAQVMKLARAGSTLAQRPEEGTWLSRPKPPLARRAARAGALALGAAALAGAGALVRARSRPW